MLMNVSLFSMALQHHNTLNVILFFTQNILYARTVYNMFLSKCNFLLKIMTPGVLR